MSKLEPVGAIFRTSNSGCEDDDGTQFIRCVDGQQLKIHEVWVFGEDGVTPEVHPSAHIDVIAFVGDYFATYYLITTWIAVPMLAGNRLMEASSGWRS